MISEPVILAIETSQREGGVALRDAGGGICVERLHESRRHDDDLMPAIDRLLNNAGLTPRDLEAVGVSIGPGGFTGLRIAVTTAKMLAETVKVNVVAVPSSLIVAQSYSRDVGPILVALASKGNSAWITRLKKLDGNWSIDGEPGVIEAAALDLAGITALIGDQHLPEAMRENVSQADLQVIEPIFDPAACLAVAEDLLKAGLTTDPLHLAPLYPRPPEAVSLWEKRHNTG